jgi:hypothetical protein
VERPIGLLININLILVRLRETWKVRKVIAVLSGERKGRSRSLPQISLDSAD